MTGVAVTSCAGGDSVSVKINTGNHTLMKDGPV